MRDLIRKIEESNWLLIIGLIFIAVGAMSFGFKAMGAFSGWSMTIGATLGAIYLLVASRHLSNETLRVRRLNRMLMLAILLYLTSGIFMIRDLVHFTWFPFFLVATVFLLYAIAVMSRMDQKSRREDELTSSLLIKGVTIINEGKRLENASILVQGERIKRIYRSSHELPTADRELDAKGLLCIPGVIDDQVHFREPGLTHKGDIESESRAAILGGVTSFMEMPNTNPQTTTLEAWNDKMERAENSSYANYAFYFGATNDNTELLEKLDLKHTPGVKVFMGSSTGNMLVDSDEALENIFKTSPVLIATHCESEAIIQKNRAEVIAKEGDDPDVKWHPVIRSAEACYESSKKAIELAKKTNAKLHILHLSTAKELEILGDSDRITGEVCVHHLWFTDQDYEQMGTLIKWNPAIKSAADRDALREAVRTGKLNIIATDHAPHLLSEKEGGAIKAASGGPLVQHSLVMMLALARKGVLSLERVVECMCHNPAQLFGIKDRGFIRKGYFADIVLIDPNAPWTVSKGNIASKCGWSPMEGITFEDSVVATFVNGTQVVKDGKVVKGIDKSSKALEFNHKGK